MNKLALLFLIPFVLSASDIRKSEEFAQGKRLYTQTCVSCHGLNGETNPDMQLIVKPRKLSKSILTQAQMAKVITNGAYAYGAHSELMPGFRYVYTKEQINNLALYTSYEFNSHRDKKVKNLLAESDGSSLATSKVMKAGKKIFVRNCSLCHGVTGNGESVYVEQSKENKEFLYPYNLTKILLSEEQIYLYAKFGGHYWGTAKEDMPSWKKKYNNAKLKAVAKYIEENIKKKSNK
ncbi:MAG: c-type cytochrome [Sulfurimonas sp.]